MCKKKIDSVANFAVFLFFFNNMAAAWPQRRCSNTDIFHIYANDRFLLEKGVE
jgi:hypothetical protein